MTLPPAPLFPLKRQSHTDFLSRSLRCSRVSTCAHALHTQYCDRTTVPTAHALLRSSVLTQRGVSAVVRLCYTCSPPSPTSMSPTLVNICMSPALVKSVCLPPSALANLPQDPRLAAPVRRIAARAGGGRELGGASSSIGALRRACQRLLQACWLLFSPSGSTAGARAFLSS